ncbi:hypothetical protein [Metapseudomonas resinovorans]|uniref:Carbon storage regulator n=1 Tax=Metapseudomonas resinovorans NBRC 106553 TaxID=1245471 RepID=S6AUG6_METRE|nr:hypothetical protein [Pseudomonas resinovorans]BAN49808.1 hypothetical protein PCA10_40760 [Pseudomonas resinovorans NBRC 106553]
MLVLCRNVGESLVIQRTPRSVTHIKVIRSERPTVVLSIETRSLDGRLRKRTEVQLGEPA